MKEFVKNFKFVWQYSKDQLGKLIIFFLCNLFYIGISIITPILSAKIIIHLTNNALKQVILMAIAIFIIELVSNGTNFLCEHLSQKIYRETFSKLQLELGKAILKLQNSCLDANSSGVFIQRFTNDTSNIADVFHLFNYQFIEILKDAGIFIAVIIIDIRVFLYMIVMILIIGSLEIKRTTIRSEKDKALRKDSEKVSGFTTEIVRGARDIKMLHAESSFIEELKNRLTDINQKKFNMGKTNRYYRLMINDLRGLFNLTLICLLVYFIYTNQMTAALALVAYNYMKDATHVVMSYSYLLEGLKDFNLSTNRVLEIINSDNYPKEEFGSEHLKKVKGDIEFWNVSFGYEEKRPVLKDLSLKIEANTTTAFVGKSGAGKTTIFNLLCKMYDPDSGIIYLDHQDIAKLDCESIRNNMTIISQNPYIFNVSIRDNLRFVKENVTEKEIKEACKLACLDDFIESLPDKYDTIVGEGGISLSGGQRQRLAIARALIQKTEIILFDEATSALDNETQAKIQDAIINLQKNYTVLIIAHRLSTIIHADRILFLSKGKIVAEGTHSELLKNCPEYKKLYEAEIEK